ncbi:MAG: hypothetical protein HY329_26855 [Chloroflexi bacterium]|nr:hypothetical protein [Chloroflexota bacterium]
MEISGTSSGVELALQVSAAKRTQDQVKTEGEGTLELIASAAPAMAPNPPHLGRKLDVQV